MSLVLSLPDNYLSRAPQEKARRAVEQAVLAGEKSISYAMPTGTGKTRVLLALLVALFVRGFQRFIIVLPNLNLLDQVKRHYMEVLGWAGVFYVCSEPGEAEADKDEADKDEADFRRSYPAASEAELREIYAREQFLIVTTYASLPKVLPATQPVDALFLDEAHHEEGPVVLKALQDHSAKYKHKISASATLLPSHKPCYTYSLSAAIHDNIIKDYELFICLTTGKGKGKLKFIKDIVAKTGNTHLIHYTAFSEADRDGATSVRKVVAELSGDPTVWVKGLTGAHSREERQAIIKAFAAPLKGKQVVKLLVNCRVLGEGADIGAANGIVFDKTTADATQLQQNIGRALRKPDGATVKAAAILFMIQIDAEELAAVAPGAERNAVLVEQVYDSGPGHLAMVAIAALLKQDPAKLRELMAGNQRFAFTRARPDLAVVETTKETVLLTQPDEDNDFDDTNGLADAITMGTDWPAAEVENILRDLADGSERGSCDGEDEDSDGDGEDEDEGSSESSSEEPEPFVQRLSDRLGRDVVIHYADSTMVASQPVGAYDKMLELLKTPTGYDLVVPAADKDNERYAAATAKTHKKGRPVNFMLEQELKELVSLRLSDDTDLVHGLTARLEVSVNAEAGADTKLPLFFKAVEVNGADALKQKAQVDEEGQLVAKGEKGWKIGGWLTNQKTRGLKDPAKKDAVYNSLTQNGTNEIVKANLDKYLAKQAQPEEWYESKTFSDEKKLALFQKATAVEMNGAKALAHMAQVNEEGQLVASGGWKIGQWFNTKKMSMKDPSKQATVYASLTQDGTNEIVTAHLDKYLAKQAQPEEWYESKTFSDEKKLALFQKATAVEMNGAKALKQGVRVDEEGQLVASGGWPIGWWFTTQKTSMKKNPSKQATVYASLTQDGTNEIVTAHLDKFLEYQAKPAEWYDSKSFSDEKKLVLFHKTTAVEMNGAKALVQRAQVNEEGQLVASGGWKIGLWFSHQKGSMKKNPSKQTTIYVSLTQDGTNKIVKANLDKFLEYQAQPEEWYESKTFSDEKKLALFQKATAVEMNGAEALKAKAQVDKEGQLLAKGEKGWGIGLWLTKQKTEMKNPSKQAAVYNKLTQDGTNEIVKANLDKFLEEQKKKKRKASDVADEEQEDMKVYDEVVAPAVEPPKKRQKKTAASAQPTATAAPAAPATAPATAAPAPASRKRPAAALVAPEEEEEQQPKPKRARKQPAAAPAAPKEPLTYDEMSEAEKVKIIERHLRQQQQKPAAGYRTTNPEAKDTINGVLARYVPAAGGGKVIFLDHTEFKTAYALLETGRVRPEDMLIPQHKPADYEKMACHELFGGFVVQGDFNSVLENFLAEGGVVRSVYADYCSTLQADGLPFVALLAQHRDKLAPGAVVGLTLTRRNPEGVCYAGQDIVKMNTALWRLLKREPENLFHTTQMAWADGQPLGDGDPYTYGAGQPMVTWLIR